LEEFETPKPLLLCRSPSSVVSQSTDLVPEASPLFSSGNSSTIYAPSASSLRTATSNFCLSKFKFEPYTALTTTTATVATATTYHEDASPTTISSETARMLVVARSAIVLWMTAAIGLPVHVATEALRALVGAILGLLHLLQLSPCAITAAPF